MLEKSKNTCKKEYPTCYIFAAMPMAEPEIDGLKVKTGDIVIAADKGVENAQRAGVTPDFIIGDFDSLGFLPEGENIILLPSEKDDTDTMAAVKLGLEKGYKKFVIYGGVGGRLDHTIANMQTLCFITEKGSQGYLIGDGNVTTCLKDDSMEFPEKYSGAVSVFCMGDKAEGVTLENLKYPLNNALLTCSYPIGVSNEFVGMQSRVTVKKGLLLIIRDGYEI